MTPFQAFGPESLNAPHKEILLSLPYVFVGCANVFDRLIAVLRPPCMLNCKRAERFGSVSLPCLRLLPWQLPQSLFFLLFLRLSGYSVKRTIINKDLLLAPNVRLYCTVTSFRIVLIYLFPKKNKRDSCAS